MGTSNAHRNRRSNMNHVFESYEAPSQLLSENGDRVIEEGFGLEVVGKAENVFPYSFGLLSNFMEWNAAGQRLS